MHKGCRRASAGLGLSREFWFMMYGPSSTKSPNMLGRAGTAVGPDENRCVLRRLALALDEEVVDLHALDLHVAAVHRGLERPAQPGSEVTRSAAGAACATAHSVRRRVCI